MMSSTKKAEMVKAIIHKAAKDDIDNQSKYFGRKFDDYFENGDGKHVVVEFVKLYNDDEDLQASVKKVDWFVGIDNWVKTYNKWELQNPTLF